MQENENVFDIIAGTSIGAINATIIISHFYENKEKDADIAGERNTLKYWEGSPEKLLRFWKTISSHNIFYDSALSLLKNNWDISKNVAAQMFPYYKNFIDEIASGESVRRYYSTKKMIVQGEPHVFNPLFYPPFPSPLFNKFFDYSPSTWWYQYSSQPLKEFILDFAPILENRGYHKEGGVRAIEKEKEEKEKEPRLLLIAADIKNATAKTFDSYKHDITVNHVLASAAIPINYPYIEIDGEKYWDGGILSNTPIRELISSHSNLYSEDYDEKLKKIKDSKDSKVPLIFDKWDEFSNFQKEVSEDEIPNLSIVVVNLHPEVEEGKQIPSLSDYDMTKDRERDIHFHDKTDYDIKLALHVSDYHAFAKDMAQLASVAIKEIKDKKLKDDFEDDFEEIVNRQQKTLTREKEPRYFYDLIGKRFDIIDVLKIQRKDDKHTISDKIYDFSSDTVSNLIKEGEKDALQAIVKYLQVIEKIDNEKIIDGLKKFKEDVNKKNTEDDQYIIQCTKSELEVISKE